MARGDFPSAKQDQFMVRFPDGLRDEIRRSADHLGRSMNAEIIQRLKQPNPYRDDDRLRVGLPTEVREALTIDALSHGITEEEHAGDILAGVYDPESNYTGLLDRIGQQITRISDLEEQNDDLRRRLERDFVLYYGKAVQLKQFVSTLLEAVGDKLPEHLRKSAEELQSLTEAETELLRDRYDDGRFWLSRRDIEAKNAQDAANEGRG